MLNATFLMQHLRSKYDVLLISHTGTFPHELPCHLTFCCERLVCCSNGRLRISRSPHGPHEPQLNHHNELLLTANVCVRACEQNEISSLDHPKDITERRAVYDPEHDLDSI